MTYDSEDGFVLLFSGFGPGYGVFADTWSYSAGVWTNLTSTLSSSPPGLAEATLVDDTYDGYPLLWGGYNGSTAANYVTTWEFTGARWTLLSPASSPPVEIGPYSMAFDPPSHMAVMLTDPGPTWTY